MVYQSSLTGDELIMTGTHVNMYTRMQMHALAHSHNIRILVHIHACAHR